MCVCVCVFVVTTFAQFWREANDITMGTEEKTDIGEYDQRLYKFRLVKILPSLQNQTQFRTDISPFIQDIFIT